MNELGSEARGARTCNEIFAEFMAHCGSRMSKNDFASATLESYRMIVDKVWRSEIGEELFARVKFSTLQKIADTQKSVKRGSTWSRSRAQGRLTAPARCT